MREKNHVLKRQFHQKNGGIKRIYFPCGDMRRRWMAITLGSDPYGIPPEKAGGMGWILMTETRWTRRIHLTYNRIIELK